MDKQSIMRNYMSQKVNPLFERLIVDLLISLPDDIIGFAVNWLQSKGQQMLLGGKLSRDDKPQKVEAKGKQDTKEKKEKNSKKKKNKGSDSESSEDEEYDPSYELEIQKKKEKQKQAGQRNSVSSEVYGMFNKKEDFKAKVVPKTEEQKTRIRSRMDQAFMFSVLDDKEKDIVIGAMEECHVKPGEWVIKQGEAGDVLYVIDEGDLDCFKRFSVDGNNTYLKTYHPGEAFGELALLYNAPRAASIQAKTDCTLWSLDRECFNIIVKDAARKKREQYEEIIKQVKLFESLDPYEATRLGDGIQDCNFKAGQAIFNQGDNADNFYVVGSGTVSIKRVVQQGQAPVNIMDLNIGQYFGDLGLLHNLPRQTTAIAKTDVKLIYLNQDKFQRLLGPISDVMIRNESRYSPHWSLESANQ